MSATVAELISYGNDITAFKYYGIATTTIFFYEYIVTLPDEIHYAWSSNKTWVFYIFLLNRYVPMVFQFWLLAVPFGPVVTQEICNKTSFISIFIFVTSTLLAQIVLTLRIYAVTGKSRPIAAAFTMITVCQLALGLYVTVLAATEPADTVPPIPFDGFRICIFAPHRKEQIIYTGISLTYDVLTFSIILRLAGRSANGRFGILRTIVRDAMKYFLVIFTAHLVLAMSLLFARPSIQLLPATGNVVYLPVMITRLMISLRKAAHSQGSTWTMGESTINRGANYEMNGLQFANRRALDRRDDTTLISTISPAA